MGEGGGGASFAAAFGERAIEREREREVNDLLTWGPNPTDRPSNR